MENKETDPEGTIHFKILNFSKKLQNSFSLLEWQKANHCY